LENASRDQLKTIEKGKKSAFGNLCIYASKPVMKIKEDLVLVVSVRKIIIINNYKML